MVAQSVERWTENPYVGGSIPPQGTTLAGVAQLAEQLICNQQVTGSIPATGSIGFKVKFGQIPERPNGSDCKSDVFDFGGSNPPLPTSTRYSVKAIVFTVSCVFLCVPLRFTVNNREHEKTFFPKFPQKQKYRFLPLSRPMRDFYLKIKSTPCTVPNMRQNGRRGVLA